MIEFEKYYKEYIGDNEKDSVVVSIYRNKPINNNFYYPIIYTKYDYRDIISVSPNIYEKFIKEFDADDIEKSILNFAKKYFKEFDVKNFIRFYNNKKVKPISSNFNIVQEGVRFRIIEGNRVLSVCKISDIYCGAANLVLYTDPDFRKQGLASNLINVATNWCLDNDLLPVFFTKADNIPSITAAQKNGYKEIANEFTICTFTA